jgi:hypothetical protein
MNQKFAVLVVLAALMLAGCTTTSEPEPLPESQIKKITLTTGEGNFTGPSNVIDWSTQNWLLGEAPPTWNYDFGGSVRILTAYANVTFDFPNPVVGGGARTELTSWHGVDEGAGGTMSSHRFFDNDDQFLGGEVTAAFNLEIPAGGLIVRESAAYAFAIGHYYTDGVGVNAPAASGVVDLTYEAITGNTTWLEPVHNQVSLEGGYCLSSIDVNADLVVDLAVESLNGLRILIEGDNEILGDVDFMVSVAGERIMHGASPGAFEMVELGPEGLERFAIGDKLELMIFNCQPQVSNIDWSIQWAQA